VNQPAHTDPFAGWNTATEIPDLDTAYFKQVIDSLDSDIRKILPSFVCHSLASFVYCSFHQILNVSNNLQAKMHSFSLDRILACLTKVLNDSHSTVRAKDLNRGRRNIIKLQIRVSARHPSYHVQLAHH
jgi:hypothetical protein